MPADFSEPRSFAPGGPPGRREHPIAVLADRDRLRSLCAEMAALARPFAALAVRMEVDAEARGEGGRFRRVYDDGVALVADPMLDGTPNLGDCRRLADLLVRLQGEGVAGAG